MRPRPGLPSAVCLEAPAWPSGNYLSSPVAAFPGVSLCRWVLALLVALPLSLGSQPVQLRGIQHSGTLVLRHTTLRDLDSMVQI